MRRWVTLPVLLALLAGCGTAPSASGTIPAPNPAPAAPAPVASTGLEPAATVGTTQSATLTVTGMT